MNFKISVKDDIALLEVGDRVYDLDHLNSILDRYINSQRKAYAICEKYHVGRLGDLVIEVCLDELARRLEADTHMFNGI